MAKVYTVDGASLGTYSVSRWAGGTMRTFVKFDTQREAIEAIRTSAAIAGLTAYDVGNGLPVFVVGATSYNAAIKRTESALPVNMLQFVARD